jgi:hypothetical protein
MTTTIRGDTVILKIRQIFREIPRGLQQQNRRSVEKKGREEDFQQCLVSQRTNRIFQESLISLNINSTDRRSFPAPNSISMDRRMSLDLIHRQF